jgi:hypothetical protein
VGQGQPVAPPPTPAPDVTVTVVVLIMAAGQVTVTGTTVVSFDVEGTGQAGVSTEGAEQERVGQTGGPVVGEGGTPPLGEV